jgi:hypothetical protein
MLKNQQQKIIRIIPAENGKNCEGRYYFLHSRHKLSNGTQVYGCLKLNDRQIDEFLMQHKGKTSDSYQEIKIQKNLYPILFGEKAPSLNWNEELAKSKCLLNSR